MNFCPYCAGPVRMRIPDGDDRPRYVCDACGRIHYQNPKIVTGAVPVFEDRVLLCKRAIEPRLGYWTLPAGFMENGESSAEGAARETREEACAEIEVEQLFCCIDIPQINQLYTMYLARLPAPEFGPGAESLDVRLYAEADIPWSEMAFPSMTVTLEHFFADRAAGAFGTHRLEIRR